MSAVPTPWPSLRADILKLREQVRRITNASPFSNTGVHIPAPGQIVSDNYVEGVSGFALRGGDGYLEIGDVRIRGGIIGNDALSDPVIPGVVNQQATNFGLAGGGTPGLAEKVGANLVVPDGCTRLLANVQGSLFAFNPNTSGGSDGSGASAYYVAIKLAGSAWSDHSPVGVTGSGGYATATTGEAYNLTGLTPGDTLRLSVGGSTGYTSVAADSGNRATVSATLLWLR